MNQGIMEGFAQMDEKYSGYSRETPGQRSKMVHRAAGLSAVGGGPPLVLCGGSKR